MISANAIEQAARAVGCSVLAIRAVEQVESNGQGFDDLGRPIISFNSHHFGRMTNHAYDFSHPTISSRDWAEAKKYYGLDQHKRFAEAAKLNRSAAIRATSWGRYQVMGFNYPACGFSTPEAFEAAMRESEERQFFCFISYIVSNPRAQDSLIACDWGAFKKAYNGNGSNGYAEKIEAAYESFK